MSLSTTIRIKAAPGLFALPAILILAAPIATAATREPAPTVQVDSTLVLQGDQTVSSLGDLTVEGENRIEVAFSRPDLAVDLDPRSAPGLTWGEPRDVLDRSEPDLVGPFLAATAGVRTPYAPRPWLDSLRRGPVARFRPTVTEVDSWQLTVVDSRGETVVAFTGRKSPPEVIAWDGRDQSGSFCWPGFTYSYVFEAVDRAGNRRRIAGQGFQPTSYRTEEDDGLRVLVTGEQLGPRDLGTDDGGMILSEIAGMLNTATGPGDPVYVTAIAGDHAMAESLGDRVRYALAPLLLGESSRIAVSTRAAAGAPAAGAFQVSTVPPAPAR